MPSKLIADLVEEHRTVEHLLASLLRLASKAREGDSTTKSLLTQHVELFRSLMDAVHHGREEDILFDALLAAGMPREQGPVAVMLSEHEVGRNHVIALGRIASALGALRDSELDALKSHATAFVQLLSSHIAKEDNVLYPMAYQFLGEDGMRQIDVAGAAWQAKNPGTRDRLLASAQALAEATLVDAHGPGQVQTRAG